MESTVSEAAKILGVSARWVSVLCAAHAIGRLVNPRLRLLEPADVRRLQSIVAQSDGRGRRAYAAREGSGAARQGSGAARQGSETKKKRTAVKPRAKRRRR